jgi:hypothetical protein
MFGFVPLSFGASCLVFSLWLITSSIVAAREARKPQRVALERPATAGAVVEGVVTYIVVIAAGAMLLMKLFA